ncbi:MAG: sporulation protein YqfC [Bacillota bacterium]|jgi:sporulation protein YqfC
MAKEKPVLRRTAKNSLQGLLTDVLELPKDLILNLPRVTMVGNIQLTLENHRGVIEYSASRTRVAVDKGELIVRGQGLQIRSIVAEEIVIDGLISDVAYAK